MRFSIPLLPQAGSKIWNNEELVREELFGPERLEEHARSLAEAQEVKPQTGGGPSLSTRLRENEAALLRSYRAIAATVENGHTITPSAEWILDNYHIVEEQIFEIKGDLPPGYYRQLPKLAGGPFAGLPARLRHRLGLCRPHGQPLRRRHALPHASTRISASSR